MVKWFAIFSPIAILIVLLLEAWHSAKIDLAVTATRFAAAQEQIAHFTYEIGKINEELGKLRWEKDSITSGWEQQKVAIAKYTAAEKEAYFNNHLKDSTDIILMNEERLYLREITAVQKREIQLLQTNIDNKDGIISAQSEIIKVQEVEITGLKRDVRNLKFQNTLLKVAATAAIIICIL